MMTMTVEGATYDVFWHGAMMGLPGGVGGHTKGELRPMQPRRCPEEFERPLSRYRCDPRAPRLSMGPTPRDDRALIAEDILAPTHCICGCGLRLPARAASTIGRVRFFLSGHHRLGLRSRWLREQRARLARR